MSGDGALRLYDSLRGAVHALDTGRPVSIYSCGPLVTEPVHFAQLRHYVSADLLRRAIAASGGRSRQAITIVDVARQLPAGLRDRQDVAQAAQRHSVMFRRDLAALGVAAPDVFFVVSEHIGTIIDAIHRFIARGMVYEASDGLYFDTARAAGYGQLAGIVRSQTQVVRDRPATVGLRSSTDFGVWRTGGNVDAPLAFDSPWGRGLPGQHLPCVVFALEEFGPHLDVHSGVEHHRQLHHVNEMAQVEGYYGPGHDWVTFWQHTGFASGRAGRLTRAEGGGTPTLTDLQTRGIDPMDLRFHLLASHYRAQATVDDALLVAARRSRLRLREQIHRRRVPAIAPVGTFDAALARLSGADDHCLVLLNRLRREACDDLHAPRVLASVRGMVRDDALPPEILAVLLSLAETLLGVPLLPA